MIFFAILQELKTEYSAVALRLRQLQDAGGRAAMHTIYAIYNSKHKKLYIGQTGNLDARIQMHNESTFNKSYTARFDGEWRLIYQETAPDRKAALLREKQLKSHQGRGFLTQFIPR